MTNKQHILKSITQLFATYAVLLFQFLVENSVISLLWEKFSHFYRFLTKFLGQSSNSTFLTWRSNCMKQTFVTCDVMQFDVINPVFLPVSTFYWYKKYKNPLRNIGVIIKNKVAHFLWRMAYIPITFPFPFSLLCFCRCSFASCATVVGHHVNYKHFYPQPQLSITVCKIQMWKK